MTIPRELRGRMRLEEGGEFIVTEVGGRIVLTHALSIRAAQARFWTPKWQAALVVEAEADRIAGTSTLYTSREEFLASLGED